jgi:hypothetical protein
VAVCGDTSRGDGSEVIWKNKNRGSGQMKIAARLWRTEKRSIRLIYSSVVVFNGPVKIRLDDPYILRFQSLTVVSFKIDKYNLNIFDEFKNTNE